MTAAPEHFRARGAAGGDEPVEPPVGKIAGPVEASDGGKQRVLIE